MRAEVNISSAVSESVEEVLEEMFYSTAVPVEGAEIPEALCAHLHFNGDPCGEFELLIPAGAARTLAASCLGISAAELSPASGADAACELANMICGATLSRLHPDAVVKLSSPEIAEQRIAGERLSFETPEGPLSIAILVN